ncbi:methyltransferase, MtaA/CmuA family [Hathewaya proteolytica DSM 3090]|uniref:Methyltransferase, MtaA/CmuA family n=1 Tax=Hathewaya proteolytica DSM 3090 TaxID=1121331 RepID=A0A1M6MBS8_9CLOT|nr:uroporphyrinogen decarboxylase family protein [Hathewaya proteolytica]SHJ80875.1 methyltransferase, MtaA/CmuA family [Hathewaya proteolytica DSM 3090]
MENKIAFKCVSDDLEQIPEDIEEKTGLGFPLVHTKGEYMSVLSKALKESKGDNICRLPFCNTVEAEALGAIIKLGDNKTGPRVERYLFNSIEELDKIQDIDFTKGRISEVLKAVGTLKEQGETVVLNIEGPFTIISSLIDSTTFYKAIRKNKDIVDKFIGNIEASVIKYAIEASKRGVDVISYSDPVGAMDLVGPKVFKEVSAPASLRIIKAMRDNISGVIIHVCGKTSASLENSGLCSSERIEYDADKTYGKAMMEIFKERTDCKVLGHACIKRTALHLKDNAVYRLIIE